MPQIKGIDVSHWQGDIDWKKVAADGVQFAFIKATEGTSYFDPSFKSYVAGAKENKIAVGTYHYAKFSNVAEAQAEAQYFLSKIKGISFDYPVVLDLEENKKGASKAQLTDAAIIFLRIVENAGYFAMIYTGASFMDSALDESRLSPFAKWVARYNTSLGRNADIWQYSDCGKVNGIAGNVDLNWSYRDFSPVKTEVTPAAKPQIASSVDNKKAAVPYPGVAIQKGSNRKTEVQRIQRVVGVTADGIFGPGTEAAVKVYQKRKGLTPDGVIGPQSWKAMFG